MLQLVACARSGREGRVRGAGLGQHGNLTALKRLQCAHKGVRRAVHKRSKRCGILGELGARGQRFRNPAHCLCDERTAAGAIWHASLVRVGGGRRGAACDGKKCSPARGREAGHVDAHRTIQSQSPLRAVSKIVFQISGAFRNDRPVAGRNRDDGDKKNQRDGSRPHPMLVGRGAPAAARAYVLALRRKGALRPHHPGTAPTHSRRARRRHRRAPRADLLGDTSAPRSAPKSSKYHLPHAPGRAAGQAVCECCPNLYVVSTRVQSLGGPEPAAAPAARYTSYSFCASSPRLLQLLVVVFLLPELWGARVHSMVRRSQGCARGT